jgi:preprotein translocase subunit SecG
MSTTALLILVMVIVVIVVGLVLCVQRRLDALRAQFGPEYQHAVKQLGDEGKADADLAAWRALGMRNQKRRLQ